MIAWAALVLAVLDTALWVSFALLVRRFWKEAEPTLRPMLAMFAPPPAVVVVELGELLKRENEAP